MTEDPNHPGVVDKDGNIIPVVASPDAARRIFERMRNDNQNNDYLSSLYIGMYDGNAPYNQAERENEGMGWLPNVNPRRAKSIVDLNVGSIWNMLTDVPYFLELTPEYEHAEQDELTIRKWGQWISCEFTKVLKEWEDFDWNVILRIGEMSRLGNGPVLFEDQYTWKSLSFKNQDLLLPRKTKSTIGKFDFACILDEIKPDKLLAKINNPSSKELGWDVEFCKKVMIDLYADNNKNTENRYSDSVWLDVQQRVKNRDYLTNSDFEGVKVVHLLAQEMGGKVSHYLILRSNINNNEGFLFRRLNKFDSMRKALHNMLFSIGDGYYYSVRGLLGEIYPTCDLDARLFNDIIAGAMVSSGLVCQAPSGASMEGAQTIRHGFLTLIPAEYTTVDKSFQPNLGNIASVRNMIDNVQSGNIHSSDANYDVAVTAKQAELDNIKNAGKEAQFTGNQAAWYYVQWEFWLKEILERMLNPKYPSWADGYPEAKKFREKLLKMGISEEWLDFKKWCATAYRSVGLGSKSLSIQIADKTLKLAGMLSNSGVNESLKQWFAVHYGWANVKRFVQDLDSQSLSTLAHSMAEGEDVDMTQGSPRTVASEDPDRTHLDVHIVSMTNDINTFRQDPSVAPKLVFSLKNKIEHSLVHLKRMKANPAYQGQYKAYGKVMAQIADIFNKVLSTAKTIEQDQMNQQASQQEQIAQMQQQIANRDLEAKKYEIDKNFELEMYKADLLNRARATKTQTSQQVSLAKASHEISREDAKAQAEINRENRKQSKSKKGD